MPRLLTTVLFSCSITDLTVFNFSILFLASLFLLVFSNFLNPHPQQNKIPPITPLPRFPSSHHLPHRVELHRFSFLHHYFLPLFDFLNPPLPHQTKIPPINPHFLLTIPPRIPPCSTSSILFPESLFLLVLNFLYLHHHQLNIPFINPLSLLTIS